MCLKYEGKVDTIAVCPLLKVFNSSELRFIPFICRNSIMSLSVILDIGNKYGLTFSDVYVDTPFHDPNWVLLRYEKNKRAFAWTYEREGHIWVNVKVDPEWRDFWRNTYSSVIPAYHQNKEHWNSIILDGTIPDTDIKRMIAESYDLICKKK